MSLMHITVLTLLSRTFTTSVSITSDTFGIVATDSPGCELERCFIAELHAPPLYATTHSFSVSQLNNSKECYIFTKRQYSYSRAFKAPSRGDSFALDFGMDEDMRDVLFVFGVS